MSSIAYSDRRQLPTQKDRDMALIKCGECKKQISDKAAACPHCGAPAGLTANKKTISADMKKEKKTHPVTMGIAIFFGFGLLMHLISGEPLSGGPPTDGDYRVSARAAVESVLKDPDSAQFGDLIVRDTAQGKVVCGTVNAKNGFGGFTGHEPFFVLNGNVAMNSNIPGGMFMSLFNKLCSVSELAPTPAIKTEKKSDNHKKAPSSNAPASNAPVKSFSSVLGNLQGDKASLGESLTMSERDALRRQLEGCWNVPFGARDAESLRVEILLTVNPDRTLKEAKVVDKARYKSDTMFRAAADSALRAVRNPLCMPYDLPHDKAEVWKQVTVTFDPTQMF